MSDDYICLEVDLNKILLSDGRILAIYYPDREVWEMNLWNTTGYYMGVITIPKIGEDQITEYAMFMGWWVDCTEPEAARFLGEKEVAC